MLVDKNVLEKVGELDKMTIELGVAVQAFSAKSFLKEFCDFYEIENIDYSVIPSPYSFHEALRELAGDDVWQKLADKTESLFGVPVSVKAFEDDRALTEELEGPDGLAPFFFVFDILFCGYEGFTLCFISGTND